MKNKIFLLLILFISISCKRSEDFEGPSLVDLYGDFTLLKDFDINLRTVNFRGGDEVEFSARFNKQVKWEITITGRTTNAIHTIEGTSTQIDASNSKWLGITSILPVFGIEMCDVVLNITSENKMYSDSLYIDSTKTNDGFLLTDFESGLDANWISFVQSGANMSFKITDDLQAPQGNFYYDMGGEVNWDYLIGLLEFPATAYGAPRFSALSNNPDKLYFNVMVYLPAGITNEILLFQFREDDNEDGAFSDGSEDLFSLELKGTLNEGWQLISIRYSDLPTLVNGMPSTPLGNGIYEPNKLHKVSVLMLADPATGYSQTLMDYVIFTENQALQP